MKGVNWSKSRKVLGVIMVCLGITVMVYRGLIWLNCTIATTILAAKVLPLQVFSVPNQHY